MVSSLYTLVGWSHILDLVWVVTQSIGRVTTLHNTLESQ